MYRTIGEFVFKKFDFLDFFMKNIFFLLKKNFLKISSIYRYISIHTCSKPKISRRFQIWSQIWSFPSTLGDMAIFLFLLGFSKNAQEKRFV